ncbi:MAG: TRAP transporter small permease subunit [Pararhodobacter sp.]
MLSLFDRLIRLLGSALSWGFAAIALMMAYEVVARYGFGRPTIWAHEIAGLLAGAAFVIGGAVCMVEGSHIRVTLLTDRLPPAMRRLTEGFGLVAGLIFLTGLSLAMWAIVQRSLWRFNAAGVWMPERSGTSWNTPAPALLKGLLLAGAVLFLLAVLRRGADLLRGRD